jgi:hypothetical protein
MENAIDSALVHRFSCFHSLNAEQIAVFATHLELVRLSPGRTGAGRPHFSHSRAGCHPRRDGSVDQHATNRDRTCQCRKPALANLNERLSRSSATRRRVGHQLFARHRPGPRAPGHRHERGVGQTICRVTPKLRATANQESRGRDRTAEEATNDRVDVLKR